MNTKAIVIAAAMVGATLSGGVAVANIDGCAGDDTCLWDDNNYQDKRASRYEGKATITYVGDAANNHMDSFANNSETYQTCAYSGANGTGDRQDWDELEHNPDVSPLNSDEVTSWRTKYGC